MTTTADRLKKKKKKHTTTPISISHQLTFSNRSIFIDLHLVVISNTCIWPTSQIIIGLHLTNNYWTEFRKGRFENKKKLNYKTVLMPNVPCSKKKWFWDWLWEQPKKNCKTRRVKTYSTLNVNKVRKRNFKIVYCEPGGVPVTKCRFFFRNSAPKHANKR